ncbi:hypothetical protein Rsub_09116 [Raphidocelis subcapitata]|uniref:Uncharacterized protein n=1 Tax=Raphidocelis subcapitata TaxID=307507 RepID=A0A2V0PF51_9CHLO|nr:hypothetical protein Rsub_09116 [Raphidocelis subcapitata]|eukprot:GBF96533.1 hypothetical protein Rsub_09116 [Raphidocelis subcapitata]
MARSAAAPCRRACAVLAVLAAATAAAAQAFRPSDIPVDKDACRGAGYAFGLTAAQSACQTSRLFCQGDRSPNEHVNGHGSGNLAQCSNYAMDACQDRANDEKAWGNPCGDELKRGWRGCSEGKFKKYYKGETSERCREFARTVTGVDPGSNQFSNPVLNFIGRRRLLAA